MPLNYDALTERVLKVGDKLANHRELGEPEVNKSLVQMVDMIGLSAESNSIPLSGTPIRHCATRAK